MWVNNFANGQWKICNQTRLIKYINKVTINSCVNKYYVLNARFWHKADIQDLNTFNDIILKQSQNFPVDTHQAKE